jgi:hypothetical protein
MVESGGPPEHTIVPNDEGEFDIFLQRLRGVSQRGLNFGDWEMLLASAERLLPLQETKDHLVPRSLRIRKGEMYFRRIEANELDLEAFSHHWKGQTVRALLEGFAARQTFGNRSINGADAWTRLLSPFYRLTRYMAPPIYPAFTSDLSRTLDDMRDSIGLANLLHENEPLVVMQRIPHSTIESWASNLENEAQALIEEGSFEYGSDPEEFDDWDSRVKEFLRNAREFAGWGKTGKINSLEELESVRESAERPNEEEPDEFEEPSLPYAGRYWTVSRLFEDL